MRFTFAAILGVCFLALQSRDAVGFVVPGNNPSASTIASSSAIATNSIPKWSNAFGLSMAKSEDSNEDGDKDAATTKDDDKDSFDPAEWLESFMQSRPDNLKSIVIVGAGWGGWGAAKALCQSSLANDIDVTILDALPDPTGRKPYLSKTGKPVEAGTRGFWMDYPNINALCEELNLNADEEVFTPFTNSSFYSPDGLEATAPVFSQASLADIFDNPKLKSRLPSNLPFFSEISSAISSNFGEQLKQPFPQLPSPLGQVLATFPLFERLPLTDRVSMVGLLVATIDALGNVDDTKVQEQYDRMTAHDLFIRFGLSERLVEDFIKPTLLVGLFKPPEELSALVVMELLYYYALAHQDSFDVRWIKNGTVSDSLIAPLAERLEQESDRRKEVYGAECGQFKALGGCRVSSISKIDDSKKMRVEYTNSLGIPRSIDADGIVLALNGKGMANVVENSPDLAKSPTFSKAASMKNGIDVISTRIWLDQYIDTTRTPANVFSRFEALRGAGGTFFMLDQLQKDNEAALWGGTGDEVPQGSVIACDFYNAGSLMSLSDEELIKILMKDLLPEAVPEFATAKVVDSWVGKYPGAVSWFSPGSFTRRPPVEGAPTELPGITCAGDWVRLGAELEKTSAKGLCQERAYASGIHAANILLDRIDPASKKQGRQRQTVLPIRDDEFAFKAGSQLNKQVMNILPRFWVR